MEKHKIRIGDTFKVNHNIYYILTEDTKSKEQIGLSTDQTIIFDHILIRNENNILVFVDEIGDLSTIPYNIFMELLDMDIISKINK